MHPLIPDDLSARFIWNSIIPILEFSLPDGIIDQQAGSIGRINGETEILAGVISVARNERTD